jgi:hypothetical protein
MALEFHQPTVGIVSPRNDFFQGLAIFAPQILEEFATVADRSKFLGIAFDAFGSGSQFTGKVIDFGLRISKPGDHRGKERSIAESGHSTTNRIGCSAIGTQRIKGENCRFSIPARICEQFRFRSKV